MARGRGRFVPDEHGRERCRVCEEYKDDMAIEAGNHRACADCASNLLSQWSAHVSAPSSHSRIRRVYGLEPEQHAAMYLKQGGRCAICEDKARSERTDKSVSGLVVDHCHDTGEVRGLLCSRCNSALGLLADNPSFVRSAYYYLTGNRPKIPKKHEARIRAGVPIPKR